MNICKVTGFSCLISVFVVHAHAQGAPSVDAGALQRSLEKQLPLPQPLSIPEPVAPGSQTSKADQASEVRVDVKGFILEGVKSIPEEKVQDVLKPYLNKSLSFSDLQKLCDLITDFYNQNGFRVLTTLPPQKIEDGLVRFLITEAKLSNVIIDSPKGESRFDKNVVKSYITEVNPIGEPLNMAVIDRASILLNEIPGIQVATQLEAGESIGDTVLRVELADTPMFAGRVEVNDYGSRSTGRRQGLAALNINNLSGIGDQVTLNVMYSEGSQYVQTAYSLPINKDGLRAGVSATYLDYKNIGAYAYPNGSFGDAYTAGVNLAYPLVRSAQGNLNVSLAYDLKSYLNKNMQTTDVVSSYDIRNISFNLSGNYYDSFGGRAVTSGSLGLVIGDLSISPISGSFGAHTPKNFTKLAVSINRTQQLTTEGTSLYLGISGQLASANLNSAEQFYLGGPYGIKAYPSSQGGGSQGALATLELRQQLPDNMLVSAFYDVGLVQQYKNTYQDWQGLTHANNTYSLQGVGLSLKWIYDGWSIAAIAARQVGNNPLYSAAGLPVAVDGTTSKSRYWLTASYQF